MKYFTQATQSNKRHSINLRQMLMLVLLLWGGMMSGQSLTNGWAPSAPGTYYLKSAGNSGNDFNVKVGDNGTYDTENAYTHIMGFTIGSALENSGDYIIIFDNARTIFMDGQVQIKNNYPGTLTMRLGSSNGAHSPNNPTLKIQGVTGWNDPYWQADNKQAVFYIRDGLDETAANRKFTIEGNAPTTADNAPNSFNFDNNFVIDGCSPSFELIDGDTWSPKMKTGEEGIVAPWCMFRLQQGALKLKNVTIRNFCTYFDNGGVIQVYTSQQNTAFDLEIDHCLFEEIAALRQPVLRMQGGNGAATVNERKAVVKNCQFKNIYNVGNNTGDYQRINLDTEYKINNNCEGTIRTFGNNKTKLTLENCHVTDNYGCAIRWHGCSSSDPMVVSNCIIEKNYNTIGQNVNGGGGLLLKGPATITNCTIRNNRTNGSGGGIYLSTYVDFNSGTIDLIPEHSILRLDSGTKIYGNVAQQNGGGVAIEAQRMRNEYYNVDGALNPYNYVIYFTHSGEPFKTQFIQNGGQVYNNTANGQYGGGIYISRSKETPFYEVICSLDFGKIYGNKAPNGYGGGVAVKTYPNSELIYGDYTPPADVAAQDVIVEVSYHDADPASTDEADKMFVYGNSANRGGGVYVEAFENTLPNNSTPNKVDVNIYGLAKVSNNNATNNGGGLYVETGTVRINSGTIGGSTTEVTATPIPSNGGNTAGNDGGGIYLNEGNIFTDVAAHVEPTGGGGGSGSGGGGGEEPPTPVLPEGFQEVEYITSTGGEVNTGIVANASHVTWAKVKRNGSGNMIAVYAVKNNNDGNNRFGCRIYSSTGHIVWRINGTGENEHKYVVGNVDEVFEVRQDYKSIVTIQNGVPLTYNYPTTAPASGTINGSNYTYWKLLANTGWGATNGNLYEAKIWNGSPTDEYDIDDPALLGWYIPCVKTEGNVVGVYDIKYNRFIPGTGNLTAGPTVRSEDRGQAMSHSGNSATMVPSYSTNRNNGGSRAAVAGCTISYNTANNDGGGAYVNTGNLFLMNAKVTDNTATAGKGGGVFTEHGSVYVNYWDANNPISGINYSVRGETTPSEIKNNIAALNGGGVITRFGKVLMRGQTHNLNDHIQISGNTTTNGSGGGIFCLGGASASTTDEYIRLINVKIASNLAKEGTGTTDVMMVMGNDTTYATVSNGCGGGVYLQHGVINMTRCEIGSNKAHINGGGVNNHAGSINIEGCTITGNTAGFGYSGSDLASGGGIFTVRGDVNLSNHPIGSSTYYPTQISDNTAYSNGGGITTRQGKVTAAGEYSADRSKNILITGNTATNGSGGGVFCLGKYGDTENTYINFTHVDIKENQANGTDETTITVEVETEDPNHPGQTIIAPRQETITNGCGGGIYLQHGVIDIFNNNIQANLANQDGGGVYNHSGKIDVDGCLIGGESADGNTANRSGGGIYTHEGDIDIEDLIYQPGNTLVRLESKVRYNTAAENGGGINTHKGTITINSKQLDDNIEISRNTANKGGGIYANEGTIIAYNAAIRNNTATENGGGINNHSGNIDLYGGMLSNNTAKEGNGGGAYTHIGDINIKPFNPGNQKPWLELSLNDGTRIYNNIANNNGGGLNNHTGLIDLHYASLQNNTSTLGNGGGIYCEGPHAATTGFTIRLLRSMVNQNKTRGQDGTEAAPTGRGGGIYLQYGRIFAQGSTLTFNKANINGGGINNHQGNIRAYGCQISNNVATTGRGGGIYANQGLIVVGPSGVAGASIIENNSAGINGGGINNHEGDIQINGDIIQNNTAGENGGGIYLALGNITMNGGKIDNNTAGEKGGGVYIGGTKDGGQGFIIQERQPSVPVVEIIDVEDLSSNSVTIHYHIVDDGNGGNHLDETSNPGFEHGLEVINLPSGATATVSETPGIGDVPGCRRRTITFSVQEDQEVDLSAQTMSVKAYAQYTPSGATDPLRGESSPVTFQLYSDKPVVVTGTVSGITATSVSASGRLFYKGDSNVQENGIGIQYSLNANMSGATQVPFSTTSTEIFPEGGFYTMDINNLPAPVNPYNHEEQPELYNAFNPDYVQQTFYYRAYATNANDNTGYGEIAQFTTPKNTPEMGTNAVEYVFVTDNGVPSIKFSYEMPLPISGNYTNYGFVLSYDDDPELKEDYTINKNEVEVAGNKFSVTVPLTLFYEGPHYPSFHYYVRAFATSAANEPSAMDITNYSITAATKFVIPDPDGKPVVRLVSISSIAQDSAVVRAIVVMKGNSAITRYGLCWTKDASIEPTAMGGENVTVREANATPNHYNNPAPANVNDSTYFTVAMTDLGLNTTYYLRVFATNATGELTANDYVYGNEFNFTTLPANPPVVRLQVDNIQNNQATIHCTIDDGGKPVTKYGIYWKEATATDFTPILYTVAEGGSAPSIFDVPLTLLQSDKEYKVYAYAKNEVGEYTGREVTFHTPYNMPELSAVTVTAITYDAAALNHAITVKGQITSAGDNTVTAYGFLYSNNTDQAPTLNNQSSEWDWGYEEQASPTVSTEYTKVLSTNVNANKRYLIRAYAKTTNSSGSTDIIYRDDYASVLTLPQVNRGADPTNVTDNGATLHGIINTADPQGRLKRYGFCWVAASDQNNPTQPETLTVESAMAAADGGSVEGIIGGYSNPYHFDMNISGFMPGTKYYWRAWVTNEDYYNTDLDLAYRQANCIAYSTISAATLNAWNYYIATAVEPASAGSVSGGGGVDVISSTNTVTLTATAYEGYTFTKWTKTYIDANENEVTVDAGTSTTLTITEGPSATYTAHFSDGRSQSYVVPRPRDIYPAPAREPWDWDDEWVETVCIPSLQTDSTVFAPADTLIPTRATAVAPVNIPSINNNSAEYGGGVYVEHNEDNPAKIVFAGGDDDDHAGTINLNFASEAGGGIYISQGASMQMKGFCEVSQNHVPADKKGGGIYLDGMLNVGDLPTDEQSDHALQVIDNWVGGDTDPGTTTSRNNVFLPSDAIVTTETVEDETVRKTQRVVTLLSDISGKDDEGHFYTNIGISVEHGFREVVFSPKDYEYTNPNTREWLLKLMPESTGTGVLNSAIFDDSENYYALHVHPSDGVFDQDYIYFWSCWTSIVNLDPERTESGQQEHHYSPTNEHYYVDNEGVWHIKSREGLAWFSSWVNGLNYNEDSEMPHNQAHPTAKAVIENDLDMSAYFWVPLGSVSSVTGSGQSVSFSGSSEYKGTFDGQGHVIKGLICTYMTGILQYGLFGTVGKGGIVKNTFVDDYRFSTYKQNDDTAPTYYLGGIAAETKGNAIISNCEARGTMKTPFCKTDQTCVGGLVGLMEGTTEVHSSMAMPEISGKAQNVGGLVGKINANNMLKNSFVNMKLGAVDGNVKVGGLVGNNLGLVENCYARLQNTYNNNAPTNFYWFAGTNTGTISYCYAPYRTDCSFTYVPAETSGVSGHGKYGLTSMNNYGTATDPRRKYAFDQKDQQITLENGQTNSYVSNGILNGLLPTLNNWVTDKNGNISKYSTWSRTMASLLNDDYPILEFADFDCLASTDNIYLEYKADLDDMIEKYNDTDDGGHIYLYSTERTNATTTTGNQTVTNLVTSSTDDDVRVYIDENVGLLQDANSTINARVGVTLDNSKGTTEIGGEKYDWHMFSSALKSASMGLKYHTDETGYTGVEDYYIKNNYATLVEDGIPHSDYVQRTNMDPPKTTWFQGNVCIDSVGYFPINTPYGTWRSTPAGENGSFDFYCYGEAYYQHWINFKREGREGLYDHWRQDPDPDNFKHYQIKYPNESTFTQAKGYMVGINEKHSDLENGGYEGNPERRNMMMADGELNNGKIEYKATYTIDPEAPAYDHEVRGCNLIGNPYQSYLNFDEFIDGNSGKVLGNTYFILDADQGRYVSYTKGASDNPIAAPGYIHPHQGFLVKVRENQTLTFTNAMRSATGNADSYFRSGRLNYPLVNLICTDATGKCDATTIEINRPDVGGGQKMKGIRTGNALVYVHLDGVDYQTAFAPVGITSAPVRLDVLEDGVFTMRWGTMHGDFSYLHLIDNLTGMDVDCLRQSEYHFEARKTDYKSRFKLVFDCTGVDENENDISASAASFAFLMGNELVVNGEGYLQVFDLNGRQLLAKQVYGTQNTVGLPKVAAGLYVLRLTTNNQSKTQKMVIE